MDKVLRFLRSEDGPTAVEYAVMLGLVVCVALLTIGNLGRNVDNRFAEINSSLESQAGAGTP